MAAMVLRLYVVGGTASGEAAVRNLSRIRSAADPGHAVETEVVDVIQNPERADADQVIATPVLIRLQPEPRRRIVGTLAEISRVMLEFQILPQEG